MSFISSIGTPVEDIFLNYCCVLFVAAFTCISTGVVSKIPLIHPAVNSFVCWSPFLLNRRVTPSTAQSYAEKSSLYNSVVNKNRLIAALRVEPSLQNGVSENIPEKEPEKQGGVGGGT